jgi:hypothetical protein
MVAEIYGWFTQGFNSAALSAARAILDDWSTETAPVRRL